MTRSLLLLPLSFVLVTGCGTKSESTPRSDAAPAPQGPASTASKPSAPAQDISTEALATIDPQVRTWDAKVAKKRTAYETSRSERDKKALVDAYVAFGDYLTYESDLSPRQGKYHRALVEYRKAVALDPSQPKALREIAQIESIYKSMNRPIPGDEASH